jgi:5-methylthioadenosine/S-adenosylhomocysteine deaminase
MNAPNLLPVKSFVSNIVYSSNPSNVSDVIIDGKLVMKDRRMVTLDEEKALENFKRVAERFISD